MNQERIVQVFFFGFLAVIAWQLYQVIDPFLAPIAWAMLLAFLVHPALDRLHRHIRSRSLAAVIVTIIVALGVILPAIWLSARLVREAQALYGSLASFTADGGLKKFVQWLGATPIGARAAAALARRGYNLEDEIRHFATQAGKIVSEYALAHGGSAASNVASSILHFGVMLITFFYLLRDGEAWYEDLRALTPLSEADQSAIFGTLTATLSSVMRGLMLTAGLDGLTIGLGYFVCGVPYWAGLAILTAAGGLLPFGGTAFVWIPIAIYLAVANSWLKAVMLVGWALVALAVIDNFVKPLAMRHGTGLPTLALFFGLAGGIEAYGPLGIFLGPAVFSVFAALLKVYQRTYVNDAAAIDGGGAAAKPATPASTAPGDAPRRSIREEN
jgi:predicted PurR-regulated permease PerM